VIAHEQTVTCVASQGTLAGCEQIGVDTYTTTGLVASSIIGGTYGDSDILVGPVSVNDGSVAVNVRRATCSSGCFFGSYRLTSALFLLQSLARGGMTRRLVHRLCRLTLCPSYPPVQMRG